MSEGWKLPTPDGWEGLLDLAWSEDVGPGDLTACLFSPNSICRAYVEAQQEGVLCGLGIADTLMSDVAEVKLHARDGDRVSAGKKVLSLEGPTADILTRERLALNFLMQLSGVASLTRQFVDAVKGTNAIIVDTRKTTPGLRVLQKYAVRCGGGQNHRFGLYDAAMLKDNHIRAAGSIEKAVAKIRSVAPFLAPIEVECESEAMVEHAVKAGANVAMLDNMAPDEMRPIVKKYGDRIMLEASGGINLGTVRAVAETGVHFISVGALTHSAPALALHLELN